MKPIITVDVVSDVVCPWCYIGKRRLENAIAQLSDEFTFDVTYHPFELNPELPESGVDQKQYLSKKFGGDLKYDQITGHTAQVAANDGLTFNFKKQSHMPNTRKVHSIIQASKSAGVQIPITEAFFKAYFTDGIDLSNDENLISIAAAHGLEESEVRRWLIDDSLKAQVVYSENEMQKLGIRGVPFYIINNKYGVSGAQASETFIKAFEDIGSQLQEQGDSCDIDSKDC